ncbi:hypothetical protein MKW92_033631 [Papaver armeniacum]|nr:hypothetical protein MKW92_033631 [Papaver armeniacum]
MSSRSSAVTAKLIGPPSIQSLTISPPSPKKHESRSRKWGSSSGSRKSGSSSPFPTRATSGRNRGFTEKGSATYVSSENPLVDFFFHVVPDTPHESVTQRLESAWKHDSLKALKLICNLRGVRGTGKSDKEGFYAAALWLHNKHPKTLAINLKALSDFGYFKDLPEILFRLHEGIDIRKELKSKWKIKKHLYINKKNKKKKKVKADSGDGDEEPKKKSRNEKAIELSKRALERYVKDAKYKDLHDKISDLFAEFLISDLKYLSSGEFGKISLASKWCPSLDSCFDKATLLCESIARRIFPRKSNPDYENIKEAHYTYRIRLRLRKEYLVPLRKVLELPEVYMSSKMWKSLPYNRVSSVAMKKYKSFFKEHDKKRFNGYLESVKKGETKIAAGALLPHEIIASLDDHKEDGDCNVAELQWRRMVDDMSKIGKLNDCLAICDVSGSMRGIPMEVSVALGLLISEMSQEPWKGKLITFHQYPTLHEIEGDDLKSKTTFIKQMKWGMTTDFQKVFDIILKVAVEGKLKEDQMIKRLFVFSDMEFDGATGNTKNDTSQTYYDPKNRFCNLPDSDEVPEDQWETDYNKIQYKFRQNGYMNVPEIVFWNLRDSGSTPVLGHQKGVALVSGFSKNLLKLFLEGSDLREITPVGIMEKAISGEEYNKLVVVD